MSEFHERAEREHWVHQDMVNQEIAALLSQIIDLLEQVLAKIPPPKKSK